MKLTTSQISSFLQSPDPNIRVVLLYGPDAGLVRERADALAKKTVADVNDPFRTASLTGSMVNDNAAKLYDEVAAQSLLGGKRLVRCSHAQDNIAASVEALLTDLPLNDSLLIIEADDLASRSKLRALCEANKYACAIPCYIEDSAQRQRAIADILKAENITAPKDILRLLAESLPPDRIALRSEIEKLAMYVRGKSTVTHEDVLAVLQDAGAAELDDLVHAIALGEAKKVCVLLDHLFAEQTSPVTIFRTAQRHFLHLQLARSYCDNGSSASEAIAKLQPKVFWKSVEPMTKQVQRWNAANIEKFLQKLFEAEAAVKRTGTPDTALCSQLMLQAAGGRGG